MRLLQVLVLALELGELRKLGFVHARRVSHLLGWFGLGRLLLGRGRGLGRLHLERSVPRLLAPAREHERVDVERIRHVVDLHVGRAAQPYRGELELDGVALDLPGAYRFRHRDLVVCVRPNCLLHRVKSRVGWGGWLGVSIMSLNFSAKSIKR